MALCVAQKNMLCQCHPEHAYRACLGTQVIALIKDIGTTGALLAYKGY